jgi:hypothetical protein
VAHPIARASIFSQLAAVGLTLRSYEESMPSNCDLSSTGEYAVKHNPAAYYNGMKARRSATRGRLETEAAMITLAESQLALAALGILRASDPSVVQVLQRLLPRARPTIVR